MKLHEILEVNEDFMTSLLIDNLVPYKRSLKTIFEDKFKEPVIMVTSITNTTCYVKFVEGCELYEAICDWLNVPYIITDEYEEGFDEALYADYETICFNSTLLSKW